MRGLILALFAFDFPGHHMAGEAAPRRSTKTTAKKTTATTV
ncbi:MULTISPECIES: hypothetical protein [unclassified Mesorhizobium]|nr:MULTISPECIES: hypothetical protein [unclassified Mesorhizobium]